MSDRVILEARGSGFVYLDLLPASWKALEMYAELHGYDEWFRRYMQPQWAAWLVFMLKAEPDTAELFPHGKWATIQRIEDLTLGSAQHEIATRLNQSQDRQ